MDAKRGKQAGNRPGPESSSGVSAAEIRFPGAPERQRILDLGASVWAFSALAGALEGGILDELATPQTPAQTSERTGTSAALIEAVLDVLTALGLIRVVGDAFICTPGMSVYTSGRSKEIVCADLRATYLLAAELSERLRAGGAVAQGWRYSDPALLDALGDALSRAGRHMGRAAFPRPGGSPGGTACPDPTFPRRGDGGWTPCHRDVPSVPEPASCRH
jgi:hypothetical protein